MAALRLHTIVTALVLAGCAGVLAQDPFITYNTSIPLGQSGFVRWDVNSFGGPVNLWLQELAPNASHPQVPLDYTNTKGFFLWEAGSNLSPGQYFYQLQSVGGHGIIFKSNPIMIICSECAAETSSPPPLTSAVATATGVDSQPTSGAIPTGGPSATSEGFKLSTGAAVGIGVGGSLFLVGLIALGFFLFRRARRRKQSRNLPAPNMGPSSSYSVPATSPPPGFWSPYQQPQELKTDHSNPPLMSLLPNQGPRRLHSHELDSSALAGGPQIGAYQSQSQSMTPRQSYSPPIIAPQPYSPPPTSTRRGLYPQHQSSGSQRTASSGHEVASYGFPSNEGSPNPEVEGFQFQDQEQQTGRSPESQQRLCPRRMVGTPNLRAPP